MEYQELKTQASSRQNTVKTLINLLNTTNHELDQLTAEIKQSKEQLHNLNQALDIMKLCITKLSEGHINHLNHLVNSMLKQVFDDKNYEVEFQLSDSKNGKLLNIILKDIISPDEIITTDIHDNGGGLQTIIGFILQVYFILYFNQEHILFLDESLSALSSDYIGNLIAFMDQLVEKYQFTFVSVIHDTRFTDEILNQPSLPIKVYNIENGKITYKKEYNKEGAL